MRKLVRIPRVQTQTCIGTRAVTCEVFGARSTGTWPSISLLATAVTVFVLAHSPVRYFSPNTTPLAKFIRSRW